MHTRLLPDLVAVQAAATGDAVAVRTVDPTVAGMTYAELDVAANQLADHLVELGVRRGGLVAVCLPRTPDLVVSLLGVWRAGAAYVPLDPAHPTQRLGWMVADSGAELVLVDRANADRFGATPTLRTDELPVGRPVGPPVTELDGHDAAYVIYTSGSTGRPKGVVIEHASIANRVGWTVRTHGIGAGDRVLQKTSLGFDAAGWELFGPLIGGGTVVLAPDGVERDPAMLAAAVADAGITVLQGVPSVLRLVVEEPAWAGCESLRLIFSAGEPLDSELCDRLAAPGGAQVWNTYGPTECAIDATAHRYDPAQAAGPVSIGRPIDGIWVVVLDESGEPAPTGVPGELHIGGVAVGRGYHGRPDLTAERFVADPFSESGSRLYRTGDLVRWRADDTLEFLGRTDDQVKVNGVRIEPAEVEAALRRHPEITGAAVVASHTAGVRATRLVAYLVAARTFEADELRTHLRELLPEALIPSVYVPLAALPLTTSGKVDRANLPEPPSEAGYIAPRTAAEELVAEVWRDLLGVERVGIDDDFFQLGGSSLEVTRLATRLRARFDGDVDLRGLFVASTVAEQAKVLTAGTAPSIPVAPVPRPASGSPLSFGQHRLWFLDQLHPGGREWVAPMFVRLPVGTDTETVQAALNVLEDRHEALRTRYRSVGSGAPRQHIAEPGPVELRVESVCVGSGAEELRPLFAEQFERGFDLVDGPLWRALLVHGPDQGPVLLVTIHHIASDGWSTVVLERELRALCAGTVLPSVPVQYADYAAWQRERLTDEVLAAELAFWRTELAGLEPIELPTDRPRPAERDSSGSGVRIELPPSLANEVTALGRQYGATPFMTLLAAFAALLSRYGGGSDIAIGTPVAGRTVTEVENVVGFFLNSLVLRCDTAGDPSFGELVDRVRQRCVTAFAHQELPFEQLVDELAPVRDLSRTPLYQVAFDLQDEGGTAIAADTETTQAFQDAWSVAKTDLTLFMWRKADGGLAGAFEYAAALFDDTTMVRIATHFVRLLDAVVADPDAPLSTVDVTTDGERAVLAEWSANPDLPVVQSVPDRIAERATSHPAYIAVSVGGLDYSYADLLLRADRLAGYLRTRGVGRGSVVGVLHDRGIDLMASLLAVWRAGAAYVPLDPSFPPQRLAHMAEIADIAVVVTGSGHAGRLADCGMTVVDVDDQRAAIEACQPSPSPVRVELDELAYVIFTSGSTGRPKGVAVSHRGLANHVRWAAEELAGRGSGGAPVFSSVAFDLVVPNLWAPLVVGQRTWMLPHDVGLDELGARLVAAGPFSFVKLTPGHFEVIAGQLSESEVDGLAEMYVVAGEAFSGVVANRWRAVLGDGRLINEYGPTEASVGTCVFPLVVDVDREVVPIGRPLPNMRMYVLDVGLRPVPVGVAGELFIGGTGVARGYVGRPDLTAERFLPDPYDSTGSRMYRTGDRVRLLADGSHAFLGRMDDQVKIRGYRIEPGEVRAVLTGHPEVADAVVVVDGSGADRRLVAYHVPVGATADDLAQRLAEYCADRLPDYMVPSMFVALTALPLNENGKIDRQALPSPDAVAATRTFTEPETPVQQRIAAIWRQILGVPRIDLHDNFFGIGGHSIRAVQLVSELQAVFGVSLPIRSVFEHPTLAGIAEKVESAVQTEIAGLSEADLLAQAGVSP